MRPWLLFLLALLVVSLTSNAVAVQSTCNVAICECPLSDEEGNGLIELASTLPACFGTVTAGYSNNSDKNGCCPDPVKSCTIKPCKYKLVVTASAAAGQSCSWQPRGPNVNETGMGSMFSWSHGQVTQPSCGESETYKLKADGVLVATITVDCMNCDT